MKIIPYILYLYLISFYISILSDIISIYGITADLLILIVVVIGLYKSETEAIWFGLISGVVAGAARLDIMPWEILTITVAATAVKQISTRINLESLFSKMVVLGGCVIVHRIVLSLLISSGEFFHILSRYIIPETAYTMIFGLLFFLARDSRISWQKFKALF